MEPARVQALRDTKALFDEGILTEAEYAFWEENGFVVVPNVVPLAECAAAARAIRAFVGADDADVGSWYGNVGDIYDESLAPRPAHGPCGMVQLSHHASLWALRQLPSVHGAFHDVYGEERLWVTTDRAHFKPPEHPRYPEWSNAGPVHSGMHWDVDVSPSAHPVPFAVQGVVYLEKTTADMGALRVYPASRGSLGVLKAAVLGRVPLREALALLVVVDLPRHAHVGRGAPPNLARGGLRKGAARRPERRGRRHRAPPLRFWRF